MTTNSAVIKNSEVIKNIVLVNYPWVMWQSPYLVAKLGVTGIAGQYKWTCILQVIITRYIVYSTMPKKHLLLNLLVKKLVRVHQGVGKAHPTLMKKY